MIGKRCFFLKVLFDKDSYIFIYKVYNGYCNYVYCIFRGDNMLDMVKKKISRWYINDMVDVVCVVWWYIIGVCLGKYGKYRK